jgi:hypothetical protein
MPHYEKSDRNMWETLRGDFLKALKRAAAAEKDVKSDGEPNPSTDIHKLIRKLFGLSGRGDPE